ncbi:hypothetical protein FA15DRAFT_660676 [Coprinopsis marcescibilis]|uniref:Uncharacterized protein n=1 Tax=Coprinopsis marcescibilis TaxID=230819 RepID=A0A5C3KFB7_COPMA|nr:hypothetical protein FA15DRAFT_660676 [Coprinopsis marcescibilis]
MVKPKASLPANTTGPMKRLDEIYSEILSKLPWSDVHFRDITIPPGSHPSSSHAVLLVIQKDLNQGNVPSLGFTSGDWDESKAIAGIPLLEREAMLPAHEHICSQRGPPPPLRPKTNISGNRILRLFNRPGNTPQIGHKTLQWCYGRNDISSSRAKLELGSSVPESSPVLATLRRYDESLTTIDEGLVIARKSAEGSAESQRVLAQLFYHRAISLTKLDRHDAALEAGSESIQDRLLVAANPDLELPLALALHSQAWTLAAHKRHKDAILFVDECIAYMRRPGQDPAVLVGSMRLYASCLWYTGQIDSALKHKRGVVEILGPAVIAQFCTLPTTPCVFASQAGGGFTKLYIPDSARSFTNSDTKTLSRFYSQLKDLDEQTYDPLLAHSLQQLVDELESNQLHPECVPATRGSLGRHAWSLTLVERHSDAIKCAEEAVTIYRRLLEEDGATVEPALAPALHRLARAYGECKRYEEAIPVLQEAVDVRKSQLEAPMVPTRDIDQETTTVLASSAIDAPHIDPSSDPVPQDQSSDAQSEDLDQPPLTNIGVPPAIPEQSAPEGGTGLVTPPSTPVQVQDSDAAPTDIVQGTESSAPPQLPDSGDVPVITAQVIPPIPDQPSQDNGAEPGPEQAVPPAVVDVPLQEEARQVVPTEVSDITVQLPEGNGAGEPLSPNHAPPCFEFDPSKREAYVGLGTSLHFLVVTSKRHSEALPLLEEAITIRWWLVDQTSELSTLLKDLASLWTIVFPACEG